MEPFLNKKYQLVKSENLEDYLKFTEVAYLARMVAAKLKPIQCLSLNEDGTYTFKLESAMVKSAIVFKLGVEFDEERPDGVKLKSIITFEGNKMIHIQTDKNGNTSKHVREFSPDKLVVTSTATGFDKTVLRFYELVQ